MQFKAGSPVVYKGQRATVLSRDGFSAKLAQNGGIVYALLSELREVSFSKADVTPARNVFGATSVRATSAEAMFKFPVGSEVEVRPTPDTASEVNPRYIGRRGSVTTHHAGKIHVRLNGDVSDVKFLLDHLTPIQIGR
jgi:hypothetical protein